MLGWIRKMGNGEKYDVGERKVIQIEIVQLHVDEYILIQSSASDEDFHKPLQFFRKEEE